MSFCRKMAGLLNWKFYLIKFSLLDREKSRRLGHEEQEREKLSRWKSLYAVLFHAGYASHGFSGFAGRNLGLFLHHLGSSWCSSSLADNQHLHIFYLISALQGPMSWRRHHSYLWLSHIHLWRAAAHALPGGSKASSSSVQCSGCHHT